MREKDIKNLIFVACSARENAYAPYSDFKVGAAVLCDDGKTFAGANVENASYGLTICAERAAIFAAISAGCKRLCALAISAERITYPCGACRQVFSEFATDDAEIIIYDETSGKTELYSASELLPKSFKIRK